MYAIDIYAYFFFYLWMLMNLLNVILCYFWQLCSLYPHNPEVLLNEMRCPSELLNFKEFSDCMDDGIGSSSSLLHVVNPAFDYVPPQLISLFVTDV